MVGTGLLVRRWTESPLRVWRSGESWRIVAQFAMCVWQADRSRKRPRFSRGSTNRAGRARFEAWFQTGGAWPVIGTFHDNFDNKTSEVLEASEV